MLKKRLPLLDYTNELFKDVKLDDCLVIACQHILETNLIMFQYLFEKGLKPNNTFLLGKCYSTNKETLKLFRKLGVYVDDGSTKFDSHLSFDEQFEEIVINFIKKINKKIVFSNFNKVILVDDGGYLLYWANNILKNVNNLIAVEQTSSGYIKLKEIKLNFPVMNVARSETKLNLESPFIAKIIVKNLKEYLSNLKLNPKNILIVGAGPIGDNISNILKHEFIVKNFDLKSELSDYKGIKLNSIIGDYDLIIGCTGKSIIKQEDFGFLKKGVILVSASSSDREFSASKLRKLIEKTNDCHKNIIINDIYLINSGFPINFDGSEVISKPEDIQLTRSLMFSAICLSKLSSFPMGIIDLDKKIQGKIAIEFKKINPN